MSDINIPDYFKVWEDSKMFFPLSWQEVLAHEPGTIFQAQDYTYFLLIKEVGYNSGNTLLAFHPAYPKVCAENTGYVRFRKVLNCRLEIHFKEIHFKKE